MHLNQLFSATALVAATLASAQTTTTPTSSPIPVSPETRAAVRQLIGSVMVDGQAYEYDRQLADTVGPRLTGSDNYLHGAKWAEEQFKSLGLVNVHTETFTMPALWEPATPATGEMTAPRTQRLHIYSTGWSPSTPADGVSGEVVYIANLLPVDKLVADKAKYAGKIVMVDNQSFGEKPALGDLVNALTALKDLGIKGLLIAGSANGTENASALSFDGNISAFPSAQVGLEDELLMKRLLEKGSVTVHFTLNNRVRPTAQVPNVVAEIKGSELPNEVVIIGAHLDSWHPGTGAQDNGTGVATVLESARAIKSLNHAPRRTVRFVLFGGEEQGLIGSTAYAKKHAAEMGSIDAVLISDTGAQPAKGWYVMGREDEDKALTNVEPLLSGLGSNKTSTDAQFIFETDHAGFDVLGVPTLVLWNAVDKYFKLHHQASDTFDSVVEADLDQGVATTVATAYAIADSSQSFAPHLNPEQVQEMLKKANSLDDYNTLKKFNWVP